jgi:ketosteroid isomerase-like protein
MAHSNDALLRSTYDAFMRGDLDGVLANCADNIVFHIPGQNQLTGQYPGADCFRQMIDKVMYLSGGSFREELHDIVTKDEHGVGLVRHTLQRGEIQHHYNSVHIWHIENGKLADFWEHPEPIAFHEAWA